MDGGDLIAAAIGVVSTLLVTLTNEFVRRHRDRVDAEADRRRQRLDQLDVTQDRLFGTLRELKPLKGNDKVSVLLANLQLNALAAQLGDPELESAIKTLSHAFHQTASVAGDPNALEESLTPLWDAWVVVRDRSVQLRREMDRRRNWRTSRRGGFLLRRVRGRR